MAADLVRRSVEQKILIFAVCGFFALFKGTHKTMPRGLRHLPPPDTLPVMLTMRECDIESTFCKTSHSSTVKDFWRKRQFTELYSCVPLFQMPRHRCQGNRNGDTRVTCRPQWLPNHFIFLSHPLWHIEFLEHAPCLRCSNIATPLCTWKRRLRCLRMPSKLLGHPVPGPTNRDYFSNSCAALGCRGHGFVLSFPCSPLCHVLLMPPAL